jgi:glycosyltransferase involved in cell wall biosynthesis
MTPEIISLTGTDGSGKSTLAAEMVRELRARGYRAEHVWLGAESVLMAPVRSILRRLSSLRRLDTPSTSVEDLAYAREIDAKRAYASRFSILVRAYVALVLLDYRLQFRRKVRRARGAQFIVADRYLYDVIVNIGVTLNWTDERVASECRRRLHRYALPLTSKYVNVPIEVAMRRKSDIPDASYLTLRRNHYETLSRELGFEYVDGEAPPAVNARELVDEIIGRYNLPRVLYVHCNNHDVGGADFVMQRLACFLNSPQAGHLRVRAYVMLRLDTRIVRAYASNGLLAQIVNASRPSGDLRPWRVVASVVGLVKSIVVFSRAIAAVRPDVVHVNDVYDIAAAVAAKLQGVPVVYHIRMFANSRARKAIFVPAIRACSSATVSVSDAVRTSWFGPRPSRNHLVAWDIADDRLRQGRPIVEPPEGERLTFLMVGRVEPWKGQHVYLDAIALLDDEQRERGKFTLVGGPVPGKESYYDECRRQAEALGVEFLGERLDVPQLLSSSDVLVHASTSPDPLPGVVIEGVLARRYVIAAEAGGVPEILSMGGGAMVPPNDPQALAHVVASLIDDPTPVHSRGDAGSKYVAHHTAPESVGESVLDVYRRVASDFTTKEELT